MHKIYMKGHDAFAVKVNFKTSAYENTSTSAKIANVATCWHKEPRS